MSYNIPSTLLSMLTYARPCGSQTEAEFIRTFIDPVVARRGWIDAWIDAMGNRLIRIGDSPIAWCCHTDTVHRVEGRQAIDVLNGIVYLSLHENASCLGADDTAGVWLMLEMIEAKVPGLYIFHRGEEVGGLGSSHIASVTPEVLAGIDIAIALDRKGTDSVITHQTGRCCSDAFAKSLAAVLGGTFRPDDSGLFTDTANYTGLVRECTNLSIGYYDAHSARETLDIGFLVGLRDTLIALDTEALVVERLAGADDEAFWDDELTELVAEFPEIAADLLVRCGITIREFETAITADDSALRVNWTPWE